MVDFQQLNALFTPVISPPGVNDKDSPFYLNLADFKFFKASFVSQSSESVRHLRSFLASIRQ